MLFTRLLVPIAPEQPINDALHQVFSFANTCSSHVTLLLVIKELAEYKDIYHLSGTTLDILEHATRFYQDSLKNHVQALEKRYPNIKFNTKVRVGIPFIEIIKESDELKSSMIVIDCHREDKQEPCQRGCNTFDLMRKSQVPIWSISTHFDSLSQVVAAVDVTNHDYQDFNIKLVDLAVGFCSAVGARLVLCHAWRLESEGYLRNRGGYTDIDIALLSQKMRDERIARLNALLAKHDNSSLTIQTQVLEGETRDVLPQFISDSQANLVILGSMSRSGIAGFVMGNTAESMINKLECSVITIKPDTFESPILMNKV
ncbi:universal stress protein [Vibrio sp. ZSDZ34]|uniref:Universal stress protein n=1 Tax=Vibrio gelatinilyticus TaxID=2893468 RepID=A0A9X2AW86_9VIBR|nr:universal stress protein [Vibrio gelatinilyticus]MCJ2376961.1 universal stress protein [Vibrio gelatinilyticus]